MSDTEYVHVQVKVPKKQHKKAQEKLDEEGMKWQGFLLSKIRKFAPIKKKRKKR